MGVARQNIRRRAAQKGAHRALLPIDRQFEEGGVEGEQAQGCAKCDGRAEEQAVIVAKIRFGAAKIHMAQQQSAAREPADHAMQHDPVGAIGEGGARRPGLAQFDAGEAAFERQLAAGIVEHEVEETQRAAQRLLQRGGVQQAVAQQGEAAGTHGTSGESKKFVVKFARQRQPHFPIGFG